MAESRFMLVLNHIVTNALPALKRANKPSVTANSKTDTLFTC